MTKVIKFEKGVTKIHFPVIPDIGGESENRISEILKMEIPKISKIKFVREINFDEKEGYDISEVVIYK